MKKNLCFKLYYNDIGYQVNMYILNGLYNWL